MATPLHLCTPTQTHPLDPHPRTDTPTYSIPTPYTHTCSLLSTSFTPPAAYQLLVAMTPIVKSEGWLSRVEALLSSSPPEGVGDEEWGEGEVRAMEEVEEELLQREGLFGLLEEEKQVCVCVCVCVCACACACVCAELCYM